MNDTRTWYSCDFFADLASRVGLVYSAAHERMLLLRKSEMRLDFFFVCVSVFVGWNFLGTFKLASAGPFGANLLPLTGFRFDIACIIVT